MFMLLLLVAECVVRMSQPPLIDAAVAGWLIGSSAWFWRCITLAGPGQKRATPGLERRRPSIIGPSAVCCHRLACVFRG